MKTCSICGKSLAGASLSSSITGTVHYACLKTQVSSGYRSLAAQQKLYESAMLAKVEKKQKGLEPTMGFIAESIVKMIESNPVAPEGMPFWKTSNAGLSKALTEEALMDSIKAMGKGYSVESVKVKPGDDPYTVGVDVGVKFDTPLTYVTNTIKVKDKPVQLLFEDVD